MSTRAESDEDLVRRFRAGDEEAGHVLFARLSTGLRPRARRAIGPELRRKVGESDVIQSAFVAVIGRLREFRDGGPGSFRRWLHGIVDRKGIDEARRVHGRGKQARAQEIGADALSSVPMPSGSRATPGAA